MSHSTFIEVTVGMTTVSYTYGTGSVADFYGVHAIAKPKTFQGTLAEDLIIHGDLLPRQHMSLVLEELFDLKHTYDADPDYLKSVWVKITRFD